MSIAAITAKPAVKPDLTAPAIEIRWGTDGLLGASNNEVYVGNATAKGTASIATSTTTKTGLKGVFSIPESTFLQGGELAGSAQARDAVKALHASLDKLAASPTAGRPTYTEPKLVGDWFAVGVAGSSFEPIKWYEFSPKFDAAIGSTAAADVLAAAKALQTVVQAQGN